MGTIPGAWDWLTTGANWTGTDGVLQRLGEHLALTSVSMAIACLVALPVAILLGHLGKGGALAVNLSNVGRAVPTFAILVLLVVATNSARYWPTVIALVLFAVPPLLTNTYVGMRQVDRDAVEAARGMGMTGGQLLARVELPLAAPFVMSGVRSAAVQVIATATLAAIPGEGGLGRIVTAGFAQFDTPKVVAGAVLVAAFALLVEGVFLLLQRLVSPARKSRPARRPARSTHQMEFT
ncbi:ABC transporter permease [Actinacidiphila glaucinigra]|uniref:Osmoprotectant transport system permease protein n=1 Tax=Actinacidiphila glaucinigra TaxID=235986 RepID=A0A239B5W6_9ACTN|nr:ABC transporter permease [Actinacidiphila glaucinigra]SNS03169.1 osmoprotectant transport system permease protein [Actinacidiphila glaucinigra]